jgi:hypothetical protein
VNEIFKSNTPEETKHTIYGRIHHLERRINLYNNPYPYVFNPYHYQQSQMVPQTYLPNPYHNYYQPSYVNRNPEMFPPVDTHALHKSARTFQKLMKQTDLIVKKIIESDKFAHDLMEAAQKSDQKKVDQLISSTGVKIKYKATFSPDGINIRLQNGEQGGACCTLVLALSW